MADVEVAVVGAGVAGAAAAHALAREGRAVLLLERFAVGHDRGSSHGSSRIFRLSYPETGWVRLAQEALPLWRELEAESGETLLEQSGTLDLGDWRANRDALAAAGARHEVLDAAEVGRRWPLRLSAGERALFQPDGGISHAERSVRAFVAAAQARGAELREGVRVERLEPGADTVRVVTAAGEVAARSVVVAAGSWARALVAPLGLDLPVTPTRETVSYFRLGADGPLPSVIELADAEHPGYALTAPGVGLKAGLHQTGVEADPEQHGAPDARTAERTEAWVARRFRVAEPLGRRETCLYTTTSDDRFVLQHVGRVVVGSACSGHGFKFAPVTGRRLAELVARVV
ncbi:MAG TPA: N-methyl-L-tryptophan oxidase [Gaiellaceae bacterium]|nr:N-methyl-L-tryptophan oxidase [Gaiellaceae bacterium]